MQMSDHSELMSGAGFRAVFCTNAAMTAIQLVLVLLLISEGLKAPLDKGTARRAEDRVAVFSLMSGGHTTPVTLLNNIGLGQH